MSDSKIILGLSKKHSDLLHDPDLVDEGDHSGMLIKDMQPPMNIGSLVDKDRDSESLSGDSVVITKNPTVAAAAAAANNNNNNNNNNSDNAADIKTTTNIKDYIQKDILKYTHSASPSTASSINNSSKMGSTEHEDTESKNSYQDIYSDSDFEEELEKRLKDYTTTDTTGTDKSTNTAGHSIHDDTSSNSSDSNSSNYDDDHIVKLPPNYGKDGYDNENDNDNDNDNDNENNDVYAGEVTINEEDSSDSDVEHHNESDIDNESDSDSDSDDELIPPPPPPKELDPDKLYALYPFQGPDPSHCNLKQDQSCVLLNDQDGYWWLIKRCSDNRIGFAPAEILETFPERLARLNCWKNEQTTMAVSSSSSSSSTSSADHSAASRSSSSVESPPSAPSNNMQSADVEPRVPKKTVSFNNFITYMANESDSNISDEKNDGQPLVKTEQLKFDHGEEKNSDDDARSEVMSDVSWGQMPSLHLNKVRNSLPTKALTNTEQADPEETKEEDGNVSSDYDPQTPEIDDKQQKAFDDVADNEDYEDPLKQVFVAPPSVFTHSKKNSPSASIGEYSPSSSEFTNDSPPIDTTEKFDSYASNSTNEDDSNEGLPTSKTIPNISMINNDESEKTANEDDLHPMINDLYKPVFNKFEELLLKIENSKSSLSLAEN